MKQHFVPKTYLKHFSKEGNGLGLHVLYNHQHDNKIRKKDFGDSMFTGDNFYDSSEYLNPKELELIFGRVHEPKYNGIVEALCKEENITDRQIKTDILEWVFFLKVRSVSWREKSRIELNARGIKLDFDSEALREDHLKVFTDVSRLNKIITHYVNVYTAKRWTVLKSPKGLFWLTSDNPGFSINLDDYDEAGQDVIPNPYCTDLGYDTVLYFPLTKDYCLQIGPFLKEDDVHLNSYNTPIKFIPTTESNFRCINFWTFVTQQKFVVACDPESLELFARIINIP